MTHWELSHPFLGSHQCHHPSPSLAFQLQLPLHLSLHLGLWLLWLHLIRAYALDQSIFVSLSSLPSGFLAFTASSENLFISLCSLTFVKTKTKFICVCVITFDLHVVADVHLLSFFQFHQFLTCEKKKIRALWGFAERQTTWKQKANTFGALELCLALCRILYRSYLIECSQWPWEVDWHILVEQLRNTRLKELKELPQNYPAIK